MGIGEPHCDCLVLVLFDLATPSPRRRLALVTPALGVSSPRQRLVLTLTPGVDFDLDLVNARVRDGTVSFRKSLEGVPSLSILSARSGRVVRQP